MQKLLYILVIVFSVLVLVNTSSANINLYSLHISNINDRNARTIPFFRATLTNWHNLLQKQEIAKIHVEYDSRERVDKTKTIYIFYPKTLDSDHDGLSDKLEEKIGSNKDKKDSDQDGLTDAVEYVLWFRQNQDIDEDGLKNIIDSSSYGGDTLDGENDELIFPYCYTMGDIRLGEKISDLFVDFISMDALRFDYGNSFYRRWAKNNLKPTERYYLRFQQSDDHTRHWSMDPQTKLLDIGRRNEFIISRMDITKSLDYIVYASDGVISRIVDGPQRLFAVKVINDEGISEVEKIRWLPQRLSILNAERPPKNLFLSEIIVDGESIDLKQDQEAKTTLKVTKPGHTVRFVFSKKARTKVTRKKIRADGTETKEVIRIIRPSRIIVSSNRRTK